MKSRVVASAFVFTIATFAALPLLAQGARKPRLGAAEIDDIARLEMLEDSRQFDSLDLSRILAGKHPEVRRRAAIAIGRIADKRGVALLRAGPLDRDTAVAASTVFAVGQLHDTASLGWLDSLLASPRTPPSVAAEAAIALGKLKSAGAREVLSRFLGQGTVGGRNTQAIREALLSIGRTPRGDLSPIVRWTSSTNPEVRWRATWALFRPRDPAAVSTLLELSNDPSPVVRSWAVRGLTKPQADSANLSSPAESQLVQSARDPDRRVSTEAVRALATYSDVSAIATLVWALGSSDSWISVSAAEGLGRIRSPVSVRALLDAAGNPASCALRVSAMNALQGFSRPTADAVALTLLTDRVPYCRATAATLLTRARNDTTSTRTAADVMQIDSALTEYRSARRRDLASTDLLIRIAAIRAVGIHGDAGDSTALAGLLAGSDSLSAVGVVSTAAMAAIRRRATAVTPDQLVNGGRGAGGRGRPAPVAKPLAEYRRIVERWVVPDYNGAPRPKARWDTPRGSIVVELYPGDAPLATDDFVRTMEAGTMIGTEFTRVVSDFVDQQQTIRGGNTLRDEVGRLGLTRGNLAWATAGLDTGSPGYTLGHTPQPHNEGDFTPLGRVVGGMEAMDRIELGDRIVAARMVPTGPLKRP